LSTGVLDQIPRSSLVLLLVAQTLVILPQVPRLSPWILLMWGICVLWRVFIYQGRWGYPGNAVKAGLILLAGVGVATSHGKLYGLDPASALLVVAFALKLLEMHDRRDALVVIYLAFFVIAVEFLYTQTMAITAYQIGAAIFVTAALVGLHQSWSRPRPLASLRTASILMLQAIPLTVVMFLFFPRVAPLWSVPLPDTQSRTGLSDTMKLGEIARLGRSEELAFRVEFEDGIPPAPGLYWRALTYSRFEDGTWSGGRMGDARERLVHFRGMRRQPGWLQAIEPAGESVDYSVIVEPTYRPWLFALDFAVPREDDIGIGRDFRLLAADPVTSRKRYRVESWPGTVLDPELPDWLQTRETALPAGGNPRTRALADELQQRTGSDAEFVTAVLGHFRREPFHYTLEPPTLQGDRIDGFLFDSRRGFCEHYAGAFVYLTRLAGIPSRVVAGYQGGEPNPMASHLIVRQYDAHAWAEVWYPDRGWVRVDPTAAVAPQRIERGALDSLGEGGGEQVEGLWRSDGLRAMDWAMDVLYFIDSLEHRWNVLVLSYDATSQNEFFEDLLGEVTPTRIAVAVSIAGGLAVGLSGLGFLVSSLRHRRRPLLRLHDSLGDAFARAGLPRALKESPRAWGRRLQAARPRLTVEIEAVVGPLDRALFDPDAPEPDLAPAWRALRRIRARLILERLAGTFRRRPRSDGRPS
jgi:transglutaminase-like putative cysteine protease